jgi:molybdopterin converting factor small subunit
VSEVVDKPWGHELIWAKTDRYVGKILHIKAGESLSLQYHRVKDETIMVLTGKLQLQYFADGEDVRTRDGLDTTVRDSSTIILLPAMAGGR